MTTMSSPKPQASLSTPSSPEELTVVQLVSSRSAEPTPVCSAEPTPGCSAEPTPGSSRDMPEQPSSSGSSGRRINLYADEIRSQWNLFMIFSTLGTHEQCIAFAEQRGLLLTSKMCTYHKQPMKLTETTSHGQVGKFSCRKGKCRNKSYSRALETWFENSRLPLPLIFQLTYLFSENYTYELARKETTHYRETVVSQATIADWYSYCREAIVVYHLENEDNLQKIGGPGKIVQIIQISDRTELVNPDPA
ncbi:uncharacterized protein LOC124542777 [Vanessa cardui]|uniref:uncharacterized protein LOC124542777 n=1 Tax=Vanessa cardui TaxID=171605 RepID=UPI001F132048|nr:uncharacterized protein LOC124542777 [Vanessa cardui]